MDWPSESMDTELRHWREIHENVRRKKRACGKCEGVFRNKNRKSYRKIEGIVSGQCSTRRVKAGSVRVSTYNSLSILFLINLNIQTREKFTRLCIFN